VSEAPDYIEPLLGWRLWRIAHGGSEVRLTSPFYRTTWPPSEPLLARCAHLPVWRRRRRHHVPEEDCTCGIYAASLEVLEHEIPGASLWGWPRLAIGRVALWGRVVQTERGWRGEMAYPERLFVILAPGGDRDKATRIAEGLERYGVEVGVIGAPTKHARFDSLPDLLEVA
jgi:hypothetical protein